MKTFITYEELRQYALNEGVPDNQYHIEIWAKDNGYYKILKHTDKGVIFYYLKAKVWG